MTDASRFHRRAAGFGLAAALMSSFGQSFFIGMFGAPAQASLWRTIPLWLLAGAAIIALLR